MTNAELTKLFPQICARISSGELLTDICAELEIPRASFYVWLNADKERIDEYARAREEQQHSWADEIVKLADKSRPGNTVTEKCDGTVETKTGDMVERTRLQIESRKWLMARLAPRTYGDKVQAEIVGKDGGPVQHIYTWGEDPAAKPKA